MHSNFNDLKTQNMTADKFLKDKGWYAGSLMLSKTKGQGLVSITEAMEEYHQAKLRLLGIANVVGQSEQLKAVQKLKDFAYEVCPLHREDDLEEIVGSL